ncbi:MAG: DUF4372 domain-containing protein [Bacteroidales bacterium]|nr:DUF4372 domain-containing protein [Bacteroidales bacterium]
MFQDKYVFSQLIAFLNRTQFNNNVRKRNGNRFVKHLRHSFTSKTARFPS